MFDSAISEEAPVYIGKNNTLQSFNNSIYNKMNGLINIMYYNMHYQSVSVAGG